VFLCIQPGNQYVFESFSLSSCEPDSNVHGHLSLHSADAVLRLYLPVQFLQGINYPHRLLDDLDLYPLLFFHSFVKCWSFLCKCITMNYELSFNERSQNAKSRTTLISGCVCKVKDLIQELSDMDC